MSIMIPDIMIIPPRLPLLGLNCSRKLNWILFGLAVSDGHSEETVQGGICSEDGVLLKALMFHVGIDMFNIQTGNIVGCFISVLSQQPLF